MQKNNLLDNITNKATKWIGSTGSLLAHTLFFIFIFVLVLFHISLNTVLLILTTVVSLEAIYLAIFIQRTVNQSQETFTEELEDLEEAISEDIDETEAALMRDLDDTEKHISDDIDETEVKLGKDLDATERDIVKKTPKVLERPMDDLLEEIRLVVREEVKKALEKKAK